MKKFFEGLPADWRETNAAKAREISGMVKGKGSKAIKGLLEKTAQDLQLKTQKA
jgi:hypothetical protein